MGMKLKGLFTASGKRKRLRINGKHQRKFLLSRSLSAWSEHSLKVQIHLFVRKKEQWCFLGKNILKNFTLICFDLQGNRCNINEDAILS